MLHVFDWNSNTNTTVNTGLMLSPSMRMHAMQLREVPLPEMGTY